MRKFIYVMIVVIAVVCYFPGLNAKQKSFNTIHPPSNEMRYVVDDSGAYHVHAMTGEEAYGNRFKSGESFTDGFALMSLSTTQNFWVGISGNRVSEIFDVKRRGLSENIITIWDNGCVPAMVTKSVPLWETKRAYTIGKFSEGVFSIADKTGKYFVTLLGEETSPIRASILGDIRHGWANGYINGRWGYVSKDMHMPGEDDCLYAYPFDDFGFGRKIIKNSHFRYVDSNLEFVTGLEFNWGSPVSSAGDTFVEDLNGDRYHIQFEQTDTGYKVSKMYGTIFSKDDWCKPFNGQSHTYGYYSDGAENEYYVVNKRGDQLYLGDFSKIIGLTDNILTVELDQECFCIDIITGKRIF